MAEKEKEYLWKFGIRDNTMTPDDTTDYIATVDKNQTLSIEDIAKRNAWTAAWPRWMKIPPIIATDKKTTIYSRIVCGATPLDAKKKVYPQ